MCHQKKPNFKTYFDLIEKFLIRMNEYDENKKIPYFSFNFLTEYTRKTKDLFKTFNLIKWYYF
jgi:hypothetical protein